LTLIVGQYFAKVDNNIKAVALKLDIGKSTIFNLIKKKEQKLLVNLILSYHILHPCVLIALVTFAKKYLKR